ncbi:MAG: pectate lyase [Caldilinea sp. CFX5]|nr:pectate lyase [Caldilinea sp. CFX5]
MVHYRSFTKTIACPLLVVWLLLLNTSCFGQIPLPQTNKPATATAEKGVAGVKTENAAAPQQEKDAPVDAEGAAAKNACLVPAFPGAEGFGAFAQGGRGGRIIEVTNLNSEGPGSLREAIAATGPRIVVFRVGGIIELTSRLSIKEPYITIAGQTAPGGGITLKGSGVEKDLLKISTHDVILRHLRVRHGPGGDSGGVTIDGGDTHDVILDHMSISWSVDENLTAWYDNQDITIQWSIIAEALHNSTHSEGPHSKGLMLGSKGSRNVSVHHNLLAHNVERNPRIQTDGLVDFRNNVIYNYGAAVGWITNDKGSASLNYVGNYVKPGPNSDISRYELEIDQRTSEEGTVAVYVEGNLGPNRTDNNQPQERVVKPDGYAFLIGQPHKAAFVTTTSAQEAYQQVLANAGATLPMRDSVDHRIVQEVMNGTGQIIDDPAQVGGWPAIASGTPPADSDQDGMPDAWEKQYGFSPHLGSDGNMDADNDGYHNVEEYLNGSNPLEQDQSTLQECNYLPVITH